MCGGTAHRSRGVLVRGHAELGELDLLLGELGLRRADLVSSAPQTVASASQTLRPSTRLHVVILVSVSGSLLDELLLLLAQECLRGGRSAKRAARVTAASVTSTLPDHGE